MGVTDAKPRGREGRCNAPRGRADAPRGRAVRSRDAGRLRSLAVQPVPDRDTYTYALSDKYNRRYYRLGERLPATPTSGAVQPASIP
eukprot:5737143-Prymnesium_polylepis.1